jgi:hypothetical protein
MSCFLFSIWKELLFINHTRTIKHIAPPIFQAVKFQVSMHATPFVFTLHLAVSDCSQWSLVLQHLCVILFPKMLTDEQTHRMYGAVTLNFSLFFKPCPKYRYKNIYTKLTEEKIIRFTFAVNIMLM